MPTIHDAVRASYSNVVTVYGNSINDLSALDANKAEISLNQETINNELTNLINSYNLEQVKSKAMSLLQATDWATLSDVTTATPKLINQASFFTYRQAIRAIAVNPQLNPSWPSLPTEEWA